VSILVFVFVFICVLAFVSFVLIVLFGMCELVLPVGCKLDSGVGWGIDHKFSIGARWVQLTRSPL
jgi:hypothetical protein